MDAFKQKAEGIINFINNGIDFELLQEIIKITMCPKSNELSAWTNWLTYDEWFEHFRERSKKRVISEERIILVLDYLKLNYKNYFPTSNSYPKPILGVDKKFSWDKIDLEFTQTVYSIIKMWESSKILNK